MKRGRQIVIVGKRAMLIIQIVRYLSVRDVNFSMHYTFRIFGVCQNCRQFRKLYSVKSNTTKTGNKRTKNFNTAKKWLNRECKNQRMKFFRDSLADRQHRRAMCPNRNHRHLQSRPLRDHRVITRRGFCWTSS